MVSSTSFSWLRRPLGLLAPGSNQGFGWCVYISLASGHVIDGCLRWLQPLHKHPTPSRALSERGHRPTHQLPIDWHRLSLEMVLSKWRRPILSHITSAPRLVLGYMNFEIPRSTFPGDEIKRPVD